MISLELLVFCWVFAFLLELQNRILGGIRGPGGLGGRPGIPGGGDDIGTPGGGGGGGGGRGADILYLLCNHFYYLFIFFYC